MCVCVDVIATPALAVGELIFRLHRARIIRCRRRRVPTMGLCAAIIQ
jgi:hypothetical protein